MLGFFIFINLLFVPEVVHPLHMSFVSVEMQTGQKVEVVAKLFSDDFESAIFKHSGEHAELTKNSTTAQAGKLAADYVRSKFRIKTGREISFEFVKLERNHEATWVYLKSKKKVDEVQSFSVWNDLMNEMFFDQRNLVIVSLNGAEKPYKFSSRNKEIVVQVSEF